MACGKFVIPYGFKTLVETLGKSVLLVQPVDVHQFASVYFKKLLEFRAVNPTLDLRELVRLFYVNKVIHSGPEERKKWLSDSEEPTDPSGTTSSNALAPTDEAACFLNKKTSLEDVPILHENLSPSLLMSETSLNKHNMVSKKEISDIVNEEPPSFVYIYTNICSVNQDESGFTYIYTNSSSANQDIESTSLECGPVHLEVETGPVINNALLASCESTPQRQFNHPLALARGKRSKNDFSTTKQITAHKSQPVSRKSESVPETFSVHCSPSSGTALYKKAVSVAHRAVPVHIEAIQTHTEHTSALYPDASTLNSYEQLLLALGRISKAASAELELCQTDSPVYMVDMTPGDHKNQPEKCNSGECFSILKTRKTKKENLGSFLYTKKTDVNENDIKKMEIRKESGINDAVNEIQETDPLSSNSQNENVLSQHTSALENERSAYHSYRHVPDSQLDLQLFHSETQQEALNVLTEIFHKVFVRLGALEFQVQDLVNRFESLSTTVNEIHSAMNINPSGDSIHTETFQQYEKLFP
ncbi:uncharacterized protein LOC125451504 [Stegostoma tigrinum]|uniref:uncharacterized protein LOC125451504 n=1 Tax=Stegostoma tigrinum TaxID=3053191 RepID=UPI002870B3A1|nr:uncharacterized protein LOC125451504 [Stegostoma tigrinum]